MRLMKKYKDTPDWWYITIFIVMVAISFCVVTGWPTGFPAWAFVVCVGVFCIANFILILFQSYSTN